MTDTRKRVPKIERPQPCSECGLPTDGSAVVNGLNPLEQAHPACWLDSALAAAGQTRGR